VQIYILLTSFVNKNSNLLPNFVCTADY